jgi:hypothetical protein
MENLRKDEKGGRMACQAARAEFPISLVIPGLRLSSRAGMTRKASYATPRKSRLPTSIPLCRRMPWAVAA